MYCRVLKGSKSIGFEPSFGYNGSFGGDSKEVSVDVKVDGETITLKGKCKVYRPKFNLFTGTYTTNKPAAQYKDGVITFGLSGTQSPGIAWNADVESPNVPNASGSASFEQLTTFNYINTGTKQGAPYSRKWEGTDVLDSADTDPRYPPTSGVIAGGAVAVDSNDSPYIIPNLWEDNVQASGSFQTYLVYQPALAGSIWVVLGKLNWSFGFSGTYNENALPFPKWEITSTSPTGTVTGTDTYTLPEWSKRAQEIPEVITP